MVVSAPAVALWLGQDHEARHHQLAWLMVLGWTTQGASGAGFGLTSLYLKGQIPDVAGIALVALVIKITCAATGFILAVVYLRVGAVHWSSRSQILVRQFMLGLGVTALSGAAFLRWYL